MAFNFDEMLKKAKDVVVSTGKAVGEVVDDVVDSSKVKIAESKVNSQIKDATQRLGVVVYESHRTGKDTQSLQLMIVDEIKGLYQTLEEIKKSTVTDHGQVTCSNCNKTNPSYAIFCISCGGPMPEPVSSHQTSGDYIVDDAIVLAEEIPHVEAEIVSPKE